MFFKKKEKKITWKKNGEYFSVYINDKLIEGDIPSCWLGDDLLVLIEKLQKYYLLKDYANLQDDIICEAEYAAEADTILWSKLGEGYYLYENGENVNDESTPIRIEDIMLVSYKNRAYLLKDYDSSDDNILQEAIFVSDPNQVHWLKVEDSFYMLNGGKLLDLNHTANFSSDDLTIYIDELEALFVLYNYKNLEDYTFYKALRMAEKDEFIWRKVENSSFNLFKNHETYHSNSQSTYHNDDVIAYVPEIDRSLLLANMRNEDEDDYFDAQILASDDNAYWSAFDGSYYLIDRGNSIAGEIGKHASVIGNDLLAYYPETKTTFFLQGYKTLQDGELRSALVLSRSAQAVWASSNNNYKIWYKGMKTGKCEHQLMGNDLMAMPTDLKMMFQLKDFTSRQDNRLRAIE